MFRLAIFLLVVILLFRAGFHEVAPRAAAVAAPSVTQMQPTSRIVGRAPAAERPVPALPGADLPETPAPLGLGATTHAEPATLSPTARPAGERFTVAAPQLALRAGPSPAYRELATLDRGQRLLASGPGGGDWLWVRTEDGSVSGYAASGLLTPDD